MLLHLDLIHLLYNLGVHIMLLGYNGHDLVVHLFEQTYNLEDLCLKYHFQH